MLKRKRKILRKHTLDLKEKIEAKAEKEQLYSSKINEKRVSERPDIKSNNVRVSDGDNLEKAIVK